MITMSEESKVMFPALARSVSSEAAYRELWAVRRLLQAAQALAGQADWQADDPQPRVTVSRHDLVLLQAAVLVASGERASIPDGFPHLGTKLNAGGVCETGDCPCHDVPLRHAATAA